MSEVILKGIAAAPGIALGPAFIMDKQEIIVPPRAIMEKEVPIEIARFEEALIKTREEILEIQKRISSEMEVEHAKIFDAHLFILEDRTIIEEVIKKIKLEKLSVEYVYSQVMKKYAKIFSNIEDEYLKERVADVDDVGRRVLKNLMDETKMHDFDQITKELILIAHDFSPSDTANMFNKKIIAFATDVGGKTSHTAIMAKSLGVPAVVGLKDITLNVKNQDDIIVDGTKGLVIIDPDENTKKTYIDIKNRLLAIREKYLDVKDLPAQTKDGQTITIMANLELPEEIPTIQKIGASGIGLYRTEYFYMNRVDLPSEEEQFNAYKHVAEAMVPHTVTIRSLDLGGDKFLSSLQIPKDMYSFLGWRAIRFCLARPDIFKTQLRAVLRASRFGKMRLMYPMITGNEELKLANDVLNEVKGDLRKEAIAFDENMPVGVMIEVPSAAMTADLLAQEAAFFSLGTNDLIQYTLAVDRVSEKTAALYEPGHPAVLRFIKVTIEAAKRGNISVGICGEVSSDPALVLVLLGLGLRELSMSPLNILQIKKLIRSVAMTDCEKLTQEVMRLTTGRDVEQHCLKRLKELAPDFVSYDNEMRGTAA
ncbi:MAG TPA: phosphoenolpyruvate--protein phosphotransferase [Candidatus Omnitrophota bacterium]|nr:phosphoenolpyruvate--protein phosphotransferase [Candidatus Omnitrophota bacterium]